MSGHEHSDNPTLSPRDRSEASPVAETPKSNNKKANIELTDVEGLLFYNIVRFNNDHSSVDWEQVAVHSNLKNAATAKVRFRQIQKKYNMQNLSAANATPKATPKAPGTQKPGSRKRKAANDDVDNGGNGVADDTPSKKQPARKRCGAVSGKGNGKAKDTNDNAGALGNDQSGLLVKKEPGIHDGGNTRVKSSAGANPLISASENVRDAPPFPLGFNFDLSHGRTQTDPHSGIGHFQQMMQQQHDLGRAHHTPPYIHNGYHMTAAQFGQLEADPAGFFGPPTGTVNPLMTTNTHGLSQSGRNEQQTASPRSSWVKKEEAEDH